MLNYKLKGALALLIGGLLTLAGCSKDDSSPEPDTIGYKIVNNSINVPTVLIEYTDENGINTMVSTSALPWEVNFEPNFTKPQVLKLDASCDCEMTAQILLNGTVVIDSTHSILTIEYTYQ